MAANPFDLAFQAPTPASPMQPYYDAFVANEASGPHQVSPQGATGRYQIIKDTFDRYAKPGENYDDEATRGVVARRLIDDLYTKTGGDPKRMAVGYFSGEGNIAPPESPTPYLHDYSDKLGMLTSHYATRYANRIGAQGATGPEGQPGSTTLAASTTTPTTTPTNPFDAAFGGAAPAAPAPAVAPTAGAAPSTNPFDTAFGTEKVAPVTGSTLVRGVRSGLIGLKETGYALKAIAAKIFGDEETAQDALSVMQLLNTQEALLSPKVSRVQDIKNMGDFLSWAGYNLGSQIPNIAATVASGGLGGLTAKIIAKGAAAKLLTEAEAAALTSRFVKNGALIGSLLSTSAQESAGTAQEQYQATGDIQPGVVLTAGVIKGALELATPAFFTSKFGFPNAMGSGFMHTLSGVIEKRLGGGFAGRVAGTALTAGAEEATTETLQEMIDIAAHHYIDKNYKLFDENAKSRLLNAAASGALLGAIFGGAGGAAAGPSHGAAPAVVPGTTPTGVMPGPSTTGAIVAPLIGSTPAVTTKPTGTTVAGTTPTPTGPNPTLDDLPKGVREVEKAANLHIPSPEALVALQQAATYRNAARRAVERNAPEKTVKDNQARAQMWLQKAIDAGAQLKPAAAPVPGPVAGPGPVTTVTPTPTPVKKGAAVTPTPTPTPGPIAGATPTPAPTPVPTPGPIAGPSKKAREIVAKAIPVDPNPTIEAMNEGVRQAVLESGNVEKLKPAMMRAFTSSKNRGNVLTGIKQEIDTQLRMYHIKTSNVIDAELNLKNGTVDVHRIDGSTTSTPVDAAAITQLAKGIVKYRAANKKRILDYSFTPGLGDIYKTFTSADIPQGYFYQEIGKRGPDDTVYLSSGKMVRIRDLKPGDVAATSKLISKEVLEFAKKLHKKIAPHEKLILGEESPTGPLGRFMHHGDTSVVMYRAYTKAEEFTHTLFHEFGHYLHYHTFAKLSVAEQIALYNAWADEVGLKPDINSIQMATANLQRQIGYAQGAPFMGKVQYQRWFDFDEWIAEGTSRFFFTNAKAVTIVEKFFKGLAEKIRALYKQFITDFGKVGYQETANEAMASWLQDMISRETVRGTQPNTSTAHYPAAKESAIKNLEYSNLKDRLDPLTSSYDDLIAAAPPSRPESEALGKFGALDWIPRAGGPQSDKWSFWTRTTWNLLQIAQQNLHIAPLQEYVEYARNWAIARMSIISPANDIIKKWRKLLKGEGQSFQDFLWAIDNMEFLPAGQKPRWPSQAELSALAKKYGITARAFQLYQPIVNAYGAVLDRIEKAWIADAMQIQDPLAQGRELSVIAREMQLMRLKPYFPHSRFGDFTLKVRDPRTGKLLHYEQFERERDAKAAVAAAQARFGITPILDKLPGEMQQFTGLPPAMLQSLRTRLLLTPQQEKILDELIFDMSPANSFSKRFKRRTNVPGYSLNAQRAFANYMVGAGGHIARLENAGPMQEAINATRASRTGLPVQDIRNKGKRQAIADWMQRHYEYIMHPPNEWTGLRSLAFQWYLGWSPASALTNLTQIPMVAAPFLSAQYGTQASLVKLMKTATDLRKLYDNPSRNKLPPDEVRFLEEARRQGFIDEAQSAELAAASEGWAVMKTLPGNALQRTIMKYSQISAFFFQAAEKLNRNIVAMSAYRLAKEQPNAAHLQKLIQANGVLYADLLAQGQSPTEAAAFLAGRDAVEKTQFEYARWARPEFMRGKKGVVFTFYMFQQQMLHFFAHQPGGTRALLLMLAVAGLQGFPGEEDLNDFLRYALEKLGFGRWDMNQEIRRVLVELTDHPDIFMHGMGHESFGLPSVGDAVGIPIPSVSLSANLGFGRLVPGVQALTSETPKTFEERLGNVAKDVAGPTYGIGIALAKALESGDWLSMRNWTPALPRAFKNVAQAYTYFEEGGMRTGTGAQLQKWDFTDTQAWMNTIMKGLGFQPTDVARQQELDSAQIEAYAYWQGRRTKLMDDYSTALVGKDREGLSAVRERIKFFNSTAPTPGLRITMQQLLQSMKERQRRRVGIEHGRAPTKTLQGVTRDVESLYPEAQ